MSYSVKQSMDFVAKRFALLSIVTSSSVILISSAIALPTVDQATLSSLSDQYFKAANSVWIDQSLQVSPTSYMTKIDARTATLLKTRRSKIQQDRQELAQEGIRYKSSNTNVKISDTEIKGNVATVRATVIVSRVQDNPAPGVPTESSYADDHVLTYHRQQGVWTLQSDSIIEPPSDATGVQEVLPKVFNEPPAATDRPSTNSKTVKKRDISAAHTKASTDRLSTIPGNVKKRDTGAAYTMASIFPSGVNPNAMATYAIKWSINQPNDVYNPDYPRFDNDCTNFVSQALFAGGWPIIEGNTLNYKDKDKWDDNVACSDCLRPPYPDGYYATYTWRISSYLYEFAKSRTKVLTNIYDTNKGDLLFADWDPKGKPDGKIDHVMMVTGKDSKGMIYISQHSPHRQNIPITESIQNAKNEGRTKITWYARQVAD